MNKFENAFYESRPYLFMLAAFITMASAQGDELRFFSGCTLLLSASYIVMARRHYRTTRR